jgi:hypothetical protein
MLSHLVNTSHCFKGLYCLHLQSKPVPLGHILLELNLSHIGCENLKSCISLPALYLSCLNIWLCLQLFHCCKTATDIFKLLYSRNLSHIIKSKKFNKNTSGIWYYPAYVWCYIWSPKMYYNRLKPSVVGCKLCGWSNIIPNENYLRHEAHQHISYITKIQNRFKHDPWPYWSMLMIVKWELYHRTPKK